MKYILVIFFLPFMAISQANIDSLKQVWNDDEHTDKNRLDAILDFTWKGYLFSQPDSAYYFAQQMLEFAEKTGQERYMASALYIQGASFYYQGDLKKAKEYYTKSLNIQEKLGDKFGIANALNNLGLVCKDRGNYAQAMSFYKRGLKLYIEVKDTLGEAMAYNNIGSIYYFQKEYTQAIEFYEKSLDLKTKLGDKWSIAGTNENLGAVFKDLNELPKAMKYYVRSMEIRQEIDDKIGAAASLSDIGTIYQKQGELDMALDYYMKSLAIQEQLNNKQGIAAVLVNVGSIQFEKGNTKLSVESTKEALVLAKDVGAVLETRDAAKLLWQNYKKLNEFEKGLDMHELYIGLNDSLESQENQKSLIRYEFEKQAAADSVLYSEAQKRTDLELLAQKNEISAQKAQSDKEKLEIKQHERNQWFYGIGLALMALLGFLVYNRLKATQRQKAIIENQKTELTTALSERETLLREIHHRVKNNLQIVSSLLSLQSGQATQKSPEDMLLMSQNRIHSMALIHEKLYQTNTLDSISFKEYLENLCAHLETSFALKEKNIQLNIQSEDMSVDIDQLVPCGLVINELVTNSIKHAFPNKNGGIIEILNKRSGNICELTIQDDGVGLPVDFDPSKAKSLGLRLAHGLCKQMKSKLVSNSQDGARFNFAFEVG